MGAVVLVLEALVVAFQGRGALDNKGKGLQASRTAAAHRAKAKSEAKEMVVKHLVREAMMMAREMSNLGASLAAVARPVLAKVQETTMALLGANLASKVAAPQLREQKMMDLGLSNLETVKTLPATAGKAVTEMPLGAKVAREVNQALMMTMVLQVMSLEGSLAQVLRAAGQLARTTILEANLPRLETVLVAAVKTAREGLDQTAAARMEPTPMEAAAQARVIRAEMEMLMGATPLVAMAAMAAMMAIACLMELPVMETNLARTALALKELGLGTTTASLPTMEDLGVPLLEGVVQEAALAEAEAPTTGETETALLDLDLVQEMALLRTRAEESQALALLEMILPVAALLGLGLGLAQVQ
ncbi:hypothetical protein N0V84_012143 [Fusarium piperis]|uniref:Uncharacterized protein n=1 Tax=Fusarium piperis TaxID=1435070 RepID=A0A9W8W3S5_9HYPO|nr:hypothetical protein N0V84_012143 [Fusarium piperis]